MGSLRRRSTDTNRPMTLIICVALVCVAVLTARAERLDDFSLVSVYDGDTFHIDLPCQYPVLCNRLAIRVIGVDTPERRGAKCDQERRWAEAARVFVEDTLGNAKTIELTQVKRGGRFRVAAVVLVDGRDLAELIIQNGMGVAYDGKKARSEDWCDDK